GIEHPPRAGVRGPSLRHRARRDRLRRPTPRRPARSRAGPHHRRTRLMEPLPLIPSTVVGSHGKPGWWFASVKAHEAGEFGPGDLDEMFDDAVDTAIRDMEEAGLDVITDGEMR